MQIDFHHTVTYTVARLAGFKHEKAKLIAHCSQYVDDAINGGIIYFKNGALYSRICSAHKMIGYKNFKKLANHRVWIPFHFLPGNGGKPAGKNPRGSFIKKIVCRPNSHVANDMIQSCIEDKDKPYSLHRLGITMHVYADTWAHQGFAGVIHEINNIRNLEDKENKRFDPVKMMSDYFGKKFDKSIGGLVGDTFPLGHGAALSFPDLPYLKWTYRSHTGQKVTRDNTKDFLEAVKEMFKVMKKYRAGDFNHPSTNIKVKDLKVIEQLFRSVRDEDAKKRHKKWLEEIKKGSFGFPGVALKYKDKGSVSWKHIAIGTTRKIEIRKEKFTYKPSFLNSDWKMFHDALLAHRFAVIRNILPKYGICSS